MRKKTFILGYQTLFFFILLITFSCCKSNFWVGKNYKKGYLIEEINIKPYGSFDKLIYKYDNKGKKRVRYHYDNSYLKTILIYHYDKKGNLVAVKSYDANQKYRGEFSYKYDKKNNLKEEYNIRSDSSVYGKFIYKYDKKNNKVE